MHGEYPVVDIDFFDDVLPVQVSLRAFTPLVPLDADASGIPPSSRQATVCAARMPNGPSPRPAVCVRDPAIVTATGTSAGFVTVRGLDFGVALPSDDFGYGTMSLTTTDPSTTVKPQWAVGFWPDGPR
jgi:non-lysosomal glucosylceramidase